MSISTEISSISPEKSWQKILDADPLALDKLRNLGADLTQMNVDVRPPQAQSRRYSEMLMIVILHVNEILSSRKIKDDKGNYLRLNELKSQANKCREQLNELDPADDESLSRLIYWAKYIEDEVNQRAAIIAHLEKRSDHSSLKKIIKSFFS